MYVHSTVPLGLQTKICDVRYEANIGVYERYQTSSFFWSFETRSTFLFYKLGK